MEELINQLLTHIRGIWKYRWPAIAVAWLVAVGGWIKVATLPDNYQTSARVFVDTQTVLKPLLSGMTSVPNVEQQVAIMSRTLLSRPNIERVIRMVDMDLNTTSARDHELQIEELLSKIKIASTGSYDIYTITYNSPNPRQVRDVVQSLLTIFVEGSFKGKKGESQKAVQFIDDQIKSYEDKLVAAENTVKEFKMAHNALLPRQGLDYGSQLLMSSDALNGAKLELMEAEQSRNAIRAQTTGDEPILGDVAPSAIDNPEIDARITALNKNLDALRLQYTELHPDIASTRRLVAQLEQRKLEESKNRPASSDPGKNFSPMLQQLKVALTEADAKVAAAKVRVQELAARHARLEAQSQAVPEAEAQLAQLNRDYQVNKDNYEKLLSRREVAKLSGDLSSTTEMMSFKIIDPPTIPMRPVGPKRALLYSGVLVAALAAGAAAALMITQVRPTFLSPAELRMFTGMNVLGTVTMNWTPAQQIKRRRSLAGFGAALGCLLLSYSGVLTAALLQ
ncbi:XrtA system polysaccharide chain length determinant [Pseudoduganella aquatica]|uniref:Chain length-determining protein n=1 Tax=Pseudoduganella aquatica TaxID=2660641 RepID=A0A7X4KNG1_9BURK|nr:XrtA system polysaccharide chain length determinant [Pseudoduganella aquatica]MYN09193.1 chain length-determining protein [Pseudoduganella aquatica]